MHVESGRHFYGGAQQVAYLIRGLAELGADNVLVCRPGSEIAARTRANEVVELPMRGDFDIATIARLRRALRGVGPDLVHVHSRGGADWFGGIAAVREGVPAILTRRVDSPEPRLWARSKYGRYAALVAISDPVRTQLARDAGVAVSQVSRISSAVDSCRYRPDAAARGRVRTALGITNDVFVIGAVGQLIDRKGHDVLLAALPRVLARDPAARLLIAGQGPLERRLERRIAALGLEHSARLLGHREDIADLLAGLDLFVQPSRSEGLGVAVLEALSTELPVVASRVGGLCDLIADRENGALVTPERDDELAKRIIELIGRGDERRRLGRRGRESVRAACSIDLMSRGYAGIYEAILQARHAVH